MNNYKVEFDIKSDIDQAELFDLVIEKCCMLVVEIEGYSARATFLADTLAIKCKLEPELHRGRKLNMTVEAELGEIL